MWSADNISTKDPLRQGDLIFDVVFPALKLPLPLFPVNQKEQTATPARKQPGIVVSQCCDNETGDYAAIAPIVLRGGLKDHQLQALLNEEPIWDGARMSAYDVEHFRLHPLASKLDDPGAGKHWVVNLNRAACFYGDCADLRVHRRARMSVEGRRLLRIKLGLLWSRVEAEDAAELEAKGIPPGLSPVDLASVRSHSGGETR